MSCGTQKIISYEYNVVTRGYRQNIKVNKNNISIVENNSTSKTTLTNPNLWKALQNGSKTIKLDKISTLKSPTNKRQRDAAMFGSLILTCSDSTYTSAGFDHGHPPVMLKTVVDSLVSIGLVK